MAKKTLLTMVQNACNELGLPAPSSLVGNSDNFAKQMLALANREGQESHRAGHHNGGWQALRKEWVFPLVIGQEAYDLPADFDFFIPQTFWDRSFRWQLLGPMTAQEWQVLKSGISPVGPRIRFRLFGSQVHFQPMPANTDTICFEYFSNAWCTSAAGADQTAWAADTDTFKLDDDILELGLKWRLLLAKGLDYAKHEDIYKRRMDMLIAADGANRSLPMNAVSTEIRLLNMNNIPDTGYGS